MANPSNEHIEVAAAAGERQATLITTNKSVRDWTELLAGDEALATADLNHSMPDLPGLAGSSRDGQFSIDVL